MGVSTAAVELYSEEEDVSQYENPGQIIKKAGTNPIIKQSGGGKRYFGRISKQGKPHLRYIIYNLGCSPAMHNKVLQAFVTRIKKRKHARKVFIALGNKFIKDSICNASRKKAIYFKSRVI